MENEEIAQNLDFTTKDTPSIPLRLSRNPFSEGESEIEEDFNG